jgi:hypothetical protein
MLIAHPIVLFTATPPTYLQYLSKQYHTLPFTSAPSNTQGIYSIVLDMTCSSQANSRLTNPIYELRAALSRRFVVCVFVCCDVLPGLVIRALLHSWTIYPGEFRECVCVVCVAQRSVLSNCKKQA